MNERNKGPFILIGICLFVGIIIGGTAGYYIGGAISQQRIDASDRLAGDYLLERDRIAEEQRKTVELVDRLAIRLDESESTVARLKKGYSDIERTIIENSGKATSIARQLESVIGTLKKIQEILRRK